METIARDNRLNTSGGLLVGGLLTGAVLMYFLDPSRGRKRRHMAIEKAGKLKSRAWTLIRQTARRAFNRTRGVVATFIHVPKPVQDDQVLNNRIRSEFGRKVMHASSIRSEVMDGVVKLSGPVLETEIADLVRCVRRVPGVVRVINQLEVH